MRNAEEMEEQTLETLSAHNMVARGEKILVGVSGGADSVALFHILHRNREALGVELAIGHVHHGIRGAEADDEADFVRRLAEAFQTPLYATRENVPADKKRLHLSTQEAARNARHAFLRTTARQIGAERIALAHTETDRIETILLRILRGTGTAGLEGFPAMDLPIIRPLYAIRREETEAYCRQWKLQICEDSSNQSLAYRRNILRLELLPYLREKFNSDVDAALLRLGEIAKKEADYLDAETLRLLNAMTVSESPSRIALSGEAFRQAHRAMQRRITRQALQRVLGQAQNVSFEEVERFLERAQARQGGSVSFRAFAQKAGSLAYEERSDQVIASALYSEEPEPPLQITLNTPGVAYLPDGRRIEIALRSEEGTTRLSQNVVHREAQEALAPPPRATAFRLPVEEVKPPLVARTWRAGDRMSPRGMGGAKKLQDLFTDAKIRGKERNSYPLLVDGGGEGKIWAVFGLRLAEGAEPLEIAESAEVSSQLLEIRLETDAPM